MTGTETAVHQYDALSSVLAQDCWDLYADAFTDLNRLAAQRHLMTPAEFSAVCADTRITKYLALRGDGTVLGMSVMTNDLDSWPLIAPAYFEHHWPEQYAARQIWYLGFACVSGTGPLVGIVFEQLIEEMAVGARACRGMVFMDFCTKNAARLVRGISRTISRIDPDHSFGVYDTQQIWGVDFSKGPLP